MEDVRRRVEFDNVTVQLQVGNSCRVNILGYKQVAPLQLDSSSLTTIKFLKLQTPREFVVQTKM